MKLLKNLTFWIFVSMIAGIATGYFFPEIAIHLKVLNDIFLRLIKMIIAPLVLGTLILGVSKMGDFKSVGRIGIKTLLYFQIATLLALALGLILVNLTKPGQVLSIPLPERNAQTGVTAKAFELQSFVEHLIPTSIFDALAHNEILQIVIFSILFGTALASIGKLESH
jgi:Na+/H+-dicarboxylate symporter